LTITHAGANTTLESLANGVPLAAIPAADDQPGVAARIERVGVGTVVPFKKASAEKLQKAVKDVLENPAYRVAARKRQAMIHEKMGWN